MPSARLEQRVAALEAEVAKLKSKLEEREASKPSVVTAPIASAPSAVAAVTMVVLDTAHMSVLERRDQPEAVS